MNRTENSLSAPNSHALDSGDFRQNSDLDGLRVALLAGLEGLAEQLLGVPTIRHPRTLRWGTKGSLSLELAGTKRGAWHDHEAGVGGGPFQLIQHARSCSLTAAILWAKEWAGDPTGRDFAAAQPRPGSDKAQRDAADTADQAARISAARRMWRQSVPITGTVAETYLIEIRAIPCPASGWPQSAVRFHATTNSLIVAATTADGEVQAVQRVRLTADGHKVAGTPANPTKITNGVLAGAIVRLPGDAAGPVIVAEGPESGLSCWSGANYETWISLGSLSNITPPAGRVTILARDDDKEWSPADRALRKAVAAWRAAGFTVKIATPWLARRGDKSDLNDTMKAGGTDAVRVRIMAAHESTTGRHRIPVADARLALDLVVKRFFSLATAHNPEGTAAPPVHAVRVDVGVGKSRSAREHAAELLAEMRTSGDLRPVVIAVPTHRLGEEQAQAFTDLPTVRKAGLTVAIWRGRAAEDPEQPGETVCKDMARVHDAMTAGANIQTAACSGKNGKIVVTCPFFDGCGYQAQRQRQADLWIVPHELMFMERPTAIAEPAALIVDESAWQDGLEGVSGLPRTLALDSFGRDDSVPLGNLESARLSYLRRTALDAIRAAPDGPLLRTTMQETGITAESAREAYKLEWARYSEPKMHPGMTAGERKAAVKAAEGNRTVRRFGSFWRAVEAVLTYGGADASGWAEMAHHATDDGNVRVVILKARRPVCEGWHVPTLLLDATLNIDLVRPHWPAAELVADVAAEAPHQRIVQVTDASYSLRRLAPRDDLPKADQRRRARNLRDLHARLAEIGRDYAPGKVLIVVQKAIEAALPSIGRLPSNVELAHHNAVAGRDGWRDVVALVVVGRTAPRPSSVSRLAEALTGNAVPALDGWYPCHSTMREMANGETLDAEADCHPNQICEAIRWTIAEGEILQIIGRARGVNRTKADPVNVLVLTDVPLPLPVDATTTLAELAPDPTELMLAAGGIAFANYTDAHTAYRKIWDTPKAAERALEKAGPRLPPNPYKRSLLRIGGQPPALRRIDYQRRGAGKKPAVAWICPALVTDPEATLTAMLGALAWCRPAVEIVQKSVAAPMPMALPNCFPDQRPGEGNLEWLARDPTWLSIMAEHAAADARAGPW